MSHSYGRSESAVRKKWENLYTCVYVLMNKQTHTHTPTHHSFSFLGLPCVLGNVVHGGYNGRLLFMYGTSYTHSLSEDKIVHMIYVAMVTNAYIWIILILCMHTHKHTHPATPPVKLLPPTNGRSNSLILIHLRVLANPEFSFFNKQLQTFQVLANLIVVLNIFS